MNYLWIDLWTKNCWLAYTLEWIIFTLPQVERHILVNELKKIIKEKKIEVIVVWLPFDLYWKDKKQLDRTTKFIDKLKNIFPALKIEWIDERYTTFESLNILSSFEKKENIASKKDSMSAFLILESYLDRMKNL